MNSGFLMNDENVKVLPLLKKGLNGTYYCDDYIVKHCCQSSK